MVPACSTNWLASGMVMKKRFISGWVVGHRQDEADSHAGTLGARLDRARRLS